MNSLETTFSNFRFRSALIFVKRLPRGRCKNSIGPQSGNGAEMVAESVRIQGKFPSTSVREASSRFSCLLKFPVSLVLFCGALDQQYGILARSFEVSAEHSIRNAELSALDEF
jgi:hypothetical protein